MSSKHNDRPAGEVTAELMASYGLSVTDLATRLGISELTLRRFTDNGVYAAMTSYPTLRDKIVRAFGVPAEFFSPNHKPGQPVPAAVPEQAPIPTAAPAPAKTKPAAEKKDAAPAKLPVQEKAPVQEKTPEKSEKPKEKDAAVQMTIDDFPMAKPQQKENTEKKKETTAMETKIPVQPAVKDSSKATELKEAPVNDPAATPSKGTSALTYDQLSAKLCAEICASIKSGFAALKDTHREALPKKPTSQQKDTMELITIVQSLSPEDVRMLLGMAKRLSGGKNT